MTSEEMRDLERSFEERMNEITTRVNESKTPEQFRACLELIQGAYTFLLEFIRSEASDRACPAGCWLDDLPDRVTGWNRQWSKQLFSTNLISFPRMRASQFDTLQTLDVVIRVTNGL